MIKKLFPFMNWISELKDKSILKADIIAGATVALVIIPQSMAYAQLAGLEPHYGLYASFLPVMIAALWGSSRQLATGPVAVVSLLIAASLEPLAIGSAAGYAVYAAFLALVAGIIQLSLGLLRLGKLVDFLSHPVILGFTNAAAIIIIVSQLSKIFYASAYYLPKAEHKYEDFYNVLIHLGDSHIITVLMGISSLILLFGLKKFFPKVPGVLIGVMLFTIISYFINYKELGGSVVGTIPAGLPDFSIPMFDSLFNWEIAKSLLMTAVTISIIGFAEAISVAKALASKTKTSVSANQELIGQGFSNISSSLFHGYPVSGSFCRSAVNSDANARTGFSSVVTAILVGVTLLFLTPLLYHLPQATLAAVIMLAVSGLIKIKPIIHAWKIEKHDGIVAVITFLVTVISAPHLENGLIVGVALSLGLFIYRSMSPNFTEIAMHKDGELRSSEKRHLHTSNTVGVYKFEGPLYFANSGYFEGKLLKFVKNKPKIKLLLLDFGGVDEIDSSGLEALENVIENFEKGGIIVLLSKIRSHVFNPMRRIGFIKKFGREKIFRLSRHEALNYAKDTLKLEIDIQPYFEYMPNGVENDDYNLSFYNRIIKKIKTTNLLHLSNKK